MSCLFPRKLSAVKEAKGYTFLTSKVPTKNHVLCRLCRRKLSLIKNCSRKIWSTGVSQSILYGFKALKREYVNKARWNWETPFKTTNLFHFLLEFITCFAVDSCHGQVEYHKRTCGCDSSAWWVALLGVVELKGYANIHLTGIEIFSIEDVLWLAKMLINKRHELHIIIFIVRTEFLPKISAPPKWVDGNSVFKVQVYLRHSERQNLVLWNYRYIQP